MKIKVEIELSNLELKSLKDLLEHTRGAHMIDIDMRKNGRNIRYEADWLKRLVITEEPEEETLNNRKEYNDRWWKPLRIATDGV